MKRSERHLLVR